MGRREESVSVDKLSELKWTSINDDRCRGIG